MSECTSFSEIVHSVHRVAGTVSTVCTVNRVAGTLLKNLSDPEL